MAKSRPHTDLNSTAMPKTGKQLGDFPGTPKSPFEGGGRKIAGTPRQPSGEVRMQSRSAENLSRPVPDMYERGRQPVTASRERNPKGGRQRSETLTTKNSAMMPHPRMSATAPGALARPGNERNSATMDARSSVPVSIQEGASTRDRFDSLNYGKTRYDNAEIDDGVGTGRSARGTFRDGRGM